MVIKMKKMIKIIAIFITLIIASYNLCFADLVVEPMIFGYGGVSIITAMLLPLIFLLGLIFLIIEIVTYICKKKKLEETNKLEGIIYKTAISLAWLGSLYIFLYLFFDGGIQLGPVLLIGSIISIIARKKKHIKMSNIVCGLVIIFSIVSFFLLLYIDGMPMNDELDEVEIAQFNEKFMQYESDKVRGTNVNSMIQAVVSNNIAQDEEMRQVEVYFSDNCKDNSGNNVQNLEKTSTSAPKVSTKFTYKVRCNISSKGKNKGLVQSISVECNEKN